MTDTEKVIGHLNDCMEASRRDNTWVFVRKDIVEDAIVLLKDQEIGHWIFLTDCSNSGVYCSECNTKVFDSYPFKKKLSYFCPHCGTRMEGEIERR